MRLVHWFASVVGCVGLLLGGDTLQAQVSFSEVLASGRAYRPKNGAPSDWFELMNHGAESVDLTGWRVTDDPSKPWEKWCRFPEGSVVPANGYLLVWCDDVCEQTPEGGVHVEMRLSREGETLALAREEGKIVAQLTFPEMVPNVSYGFPRSYEEIASSGWAQFAEKVGFTGEPGAFLCTQYNMTVGLGSIQQVTNLLQNSSQWVGKPIVKTYPVICFLEQSSGGRKEAVPYPGNSSFVPERGNFVIEADAIVEVPEPGLWTFAVCSDDGFRLTVRGEDSEFAMEHQNGRGYAPSIETFDLPEAGLYAIHLVYFQGNGGAALDVSAAQGRHEHYDEQLFRLIGTEECGLVHALPGSPINASGESVGPTMESAPVFFKRPTPGRPNGFKSLKAPSPGVCYSVPHGYYTEPFEVALSTADGESWPIRYTLDGSVPTADHGTLYTQPLRVDHTTTIRAIAVVPDALRTVETTATYLFLQDVLTQGATPPPGFPENGAVNGHRMHYPMNESVVNGPDRERLLRGFTNSIVTLSLVFDPTNFFDPARGIFVNPGGHGVGWERPVRVEQIDPVRGAENEFQLPAGIRIRGGASRNGGNPKHSLRLFFRDSYGASKLRFPLFGKEGANEFDKVDLRTSQNYGWAQNGGGRDTMVHEVFARDCQRDLLVPYTRSRFLHLFLNGVYWGLYQTQERADASFAATYFGGEKEDWDALKFPRGATDGTRDAYDAFWKIAVEEGVGPDHPGNYQRLQGRNPDGSRNLEYPVYLNTENLWAYVVPNHYSIDYDSPISRFGGWVNNLVCVRRRTNDSEGFLWFRHDAEHSLGVNGSSPEENSLGWGEEERFFVRGQFNPLTLHVALLKDPEYRMDFADYVQRICFNDGPMTTTNCILRFKARMEELDDAIVCEEARWAQQRQTRATWTNACDRILSQFIPRRLEVLLAQYRERGWFPKTEAPTVEKQANGSVRLVSKEPILYVTDYSDPRLVGGKVSPAAKRVEKSGEEGLYSVEVPFGMDGLGFRARALNATTGEWSPMIRVP